MIQSQSASVIGAGTPKRRRGRCGFVRDQLPVRFPGYPEDKGRRIKAYGAGKAVEAVKGSVRGVGKGDIYSVGDATFMDSDENFLKYIQNVDGYNGQGIRLLSCNMGALDNGFAQNLANQLNVKVYASTNYLWAERNGNYFVAGMRNQGGPNMSKLGIFRVFIPGGNQ